MYVCSSCERCLISEASLAYYAALVCIRGSPDHLDHCGSSRLCFLQYLRLSCGDLLQLAVLALFPYLYIILLVEIQLEIEDHGLP